MCQQLEGRHFCYTTHTNLTNQIFSSADESLKNKTRLLRLRLRVCWVGSLVTLHTLVFTHITSVVKPVHWSCFESWALFPLLCAFCLLIFMMQNSPPSQKVMILKYNTVSYSYTEKQNFHSVVLLLKTIAICMFHASSEQFCCCCMYSKTVSNKS